MIILNAHIVKIFIQADMGLIATTAEFFRTTKAFVGIANTVDQISNIFHAKTQLFLTAI